MWTNVFKIGGLHQISWFQFLPSESDLSPLPEKRVKGDEKDAATSVVLLSHLQLQKEGFLSTWTNSFVGPWDPSQGIHNPDEKIKLWLFLPGCHSSVVDSAQAAVSKLRVVTSGLWLAPGDSEEVAAALSQALRNSIERALRETSYLRYGDVFTRFHPFSQTEKPFRRVQPAIEFVFSATEEAIFAHVKISAKYIRTLTSDDMERVQKHRFPHKLQETLPVIVAPHGMRGRLSGCCPSDLVKQVYLSPSKVKASNGSKVLCIPSNVAQAPTCQFRGQNCFVEVTLGCPVNGGDKVAEPNSNFVRNSAKRPRSEAATDALEKGDQKHASLDLFRALEKTFLYPAEAVVVPFIHMSFVRSSLKRLWLQNLVGASLLGSRFLMNCSGLESIGSMECVDGQWTELNGMHSQNSNNSSSNSNSSSISSTSSESDYRMTSGAGDLDADADSLTCRQSGLSSNDQFENNAHKQMSKRPRTGTTESFDTTGTVINASREAYKSEYSSMEVNISAGGGVANDQVGSDWDWDDINKEGIDIQVLLSDFGDFGEFFETDDLPFGEPPGTAESHALVFAVPDCGDVSSSPRTVAIDVTDQMLLPALDLPGFDNLNPFPPAVVGDSHNGKQELSKDTWPSGPVNYSSEMSAGEFDHLSKAEAKMTFAPDYGAVEISGNELSASSVFRTPYFPSSRKTGSTHSSSSAYVYSATPPSSCLTAPDEKLDASFSVNSGVARQDSSNLLQFKKYYTQVKSVKERSNRTLVPCNNSISSFEGVTQSSLSGFSSVNALRSSQGRATGNATEVGNLLLPMRTVLAAEAECIMFQATMCRIRHTLLSSSNLGPTGLLTGAGSTVLDQTPGDLITMGDRISNRYETKKKDCIPVRIAGDFDGGLLDGNMNAPIGVWRSVGGPKGAKSASLSTMENTLCFNDKSFNEESMVMYGQRQPLQDLLDALALLVQQATSFVDVSLDAEYGDGPFAWLALEEQSRRGFSCGPSMVHAGCGGLLASCHSLDIAGVELLDPLSASVHASSVISLLHSDVKAALKLAFGNSDGPLSVTDWCKGYSHSSDSGIVSDGYTAESTVVESKDSSTVTLAVGDPTSPTNSSGVSSTTDGIRMDETMQRRLNQEISHSDLEQQIISRPRPTVFVLPLPAVLVGYQDDWLKTSANSLQLWEKAPLEPYALSKPMTYYVVCPDIDPLTSACADFFQQLGTVYEACKLGTHAPHNMGGQMDGPSRKWRSSGFLLIDCPETMKIESVNASVMGSISDYLLALSNSWDLRNFLKSLSDVMKNIRFDSTVNQKEGSDSPGMVIYVVCPFSEPAAILQTLVASATALGSTILSSDKDRRSLLQSQVGKALSSSPVGDEASVLNVLTLSGFSIPKVVLQIVSVEAILRVTSPALNELVLLKEIAFTVYNKTRRVARSSCNDVNQSTGISIRPQSSFIPMTSNASEMWKDCMATRISGSLPREGELDTSLRPSVWDNSWQASRSGGLGGDTNRSGDNFFQDDVRFLFEPLFVLAEPGSVEQGVSSTIFGNATVESSRPAVDDGYGGTLMQNSTSVGAEIGGCSLLDGPPDSDGFSSSNQKGTSLHCCYGWTEDWRWLVSVWTDSRGELLDSHIFPFGGISSRQDTKGLQCLFVQVLQQGCQILSCSSSDAGTIKTRDIVITRIGSFYELERQEWQKAIYMVGGNEVKKWPLQLRKSVPDGVSASSNGNSLPQQEMSLIQERTLPSSPSPSLYGPQTKTSGFVKGGLGQTNARKQFGGRQTAVDGSRGLFQWVQSISLIGVSVDQSLHLISQADTPGGAQVGGNSGSLGYLEGFSAVKSLGSASASYVVIPSSSMHFLPPTPLQLPTCLTSDSPPLAHLLHSKGSAIPISIGFVVSKAVPSIRNDSRGSASEEWPSVLSVGLVDYYGGSNITKEKIIRGNIKQVKNLKSDVRDYELEINLIIESIAAELHALSWMTVSPAYMERRTALPFHCDMILRLRRLIHFADKELCQKPDMLQV